MSKDKDIPKDAPKPPPPRPEPPPFAAQPPGPTRPEPGAPAGPVPATPAPAAATGPECKGVVISTAGDAQGGVVTMTHDDGTPDDSHRTAPGVVVTLNGQPSELGALRPGDKVVVTGLPVTRIAATRPKP